jgi:hypothetical protein
MPANVHVESMLKCKKNKRNTLPIKPWSLSSVLGEAHGMQPGLRGVTRSGTSGCTM